MADVDVVLGSSLGEMNIGLTGMIGFINPLSAQLDAMITFALGPFQADLSAQLDASLAAQASLSLQVTDPLAALRAALQAVAQLQAALSAALALPPITLSVSGQLSASLALTAALQAKLGLINALIEAALDVKIPLVKLVGEINAALAAKGYLLSFNGLDTGDPVTLGEWGDKIRDLFQSGITDPGLTEPPINSGDLAGGVILVGSATAFFDALGVIMPV